MVYLQESDVGNSAHFERYFSLTSSCSVLLSGRTLLTRPNI